MNKRFWFMFHTFIFASFMLFISDDIQSGSDWVFVDAFFILVSGSYMLYALRNDI